MAKRREYNPTETPAKISLAVASNLAGRLPPGAMDNPLLMLNVMMIANTASQKYAGKISQVNEVWTQLVKTYNLYGTKAALARIMAGATLKFIPRPGGGKAPCADVTSYLASIANRAHMAAEMADVVTALADYVRRNGWCAEAGAAGAGAV